MVKNKINYRNNEKFIDNAILNNATFIDYLNRFEKVARSIFEWVNLPKSMNARWLERTLYYFGQATLLKDENFGYINTECTTAGNINIYGLPTEFNCHSFEYHKQRKLYTGINEEATDEEKENIRNTQCVLVQNNWDGLPTASSMELFAYRLYEAERSIDVNIKSQKFPVLLLANDKQRLTLINIYNQYNGNEPAIFGDKNIFENGEISVKAINTGAPYVADKLTDYKKEIWNEALTFLGINNIMVDKKERLVTDEANSNNELINLNLQSYLAPRQEACKQFNELFGLTGTDKKISVRIRSDLHNIIKEAQSIVQDFKQMENIEDIKTKEGEENGEIHDRT